MKTKHQLRAEKKLKNAKKQKKKFPDFLRLVIQEADIILEVLDSRFIEETRNKEIEEFIKKKKKRIIYVLNKSDLIKKTKDIKIRPYVFVSALNRIGGKELRDKIKYFSKKIEKSSGKISVGVIGYPNTGKSSVINLLIGKSSAKTGATAGFTKGVQKLRLTSEIVLLDSPGVIPEKEYSNIDQEKISKHVMTSARDYHKVKNPEISVSYLFEKYKSKFEKFYKRKFKDAEELIEVIGKEKKFLKKGGFVDEDKVARLILKDWQEGRIFR